MKARTILIALAVKYQGDWQRIYNDIANKITPTSEEIAKVEYLEKECITLLDKNYPSMLKEIYKPPFVLFTKGNKDLLNNNDMVAYVGTRTPSEYAIKSTKQMVNEEDSEVLITTLALGINTIATKQALANNKKVIAVLPCGIDNCYPQSNKALLKEIIDNDGLVISEYPHNTEANKDNFMMRNRIVAGLTSEIKVMEVYNHSGTMVMIAEALQKNKTISVLPHNIDSGCYNNELIKEGADLLL